MAVFRPFPLPAARDLLIDTLRGRIARLRRMPFSASSEKLDREIEQLELALEDRKRSVMRLCPR